MNAEQLPIYYDAFNLLAGDKIGNGIHRDVFSCKLRPDLVVKVEFETNYRQFANVKEMEFWKYYSEYKAIAEWLAPCEYLSPDGRILLQRRADPIPSSFEIPNKLPKFITDTKRDNFGIIDGKFVCVDYSSVIHNHSIALRAVDWF